MLLSLNMLPAFSLGTEYHNAIARAVHEDNTKICKTKLIILNSKVLDDFSDCMKYRRLKQ